jgi:hypothetical protein
MSTASRPLHKAGTNEEQLTLYFIAKTQNAEGDEQLFRVAKDAQQIISDEISSMVSVLLGPMFRLEKIDIRRGSVEFWVYLAGGFTLISHYDDFVRSLEVLQTQIRNLLIGLFASRGLSLSITSSGWMPVRPKPHRLASFRTSQDFIMLLMGSYLILSHAVLLVVIVRFALKALLSAK